MVFCCYCDMDKSRNNRRGLSRRRITLAVIIDVTLVLTVGIPVLFLFLWGTPFERGFICDDPALSLPFRSETVSTTVLTIAGFSVSILVVLIVEVLNTAERKCQRPCQSAEGLGFCMNGYSVFLVGFVLQQLVVEFVKNQLGSLRPNFFDVCRPQFNQSFCPGYVSKYTCSGSEHGPDEIRESRLSFPSGHASFSMYIAIYFCFYIQRRLHVTFSRIVKLFLQFGLVFLAVVCGLSRIQDNKHHPADVIVGFFVGLTTAVLVFHFVGDKILPVRDDSESLSFQLTDEKRCCCSCGATTPTIAELQSPAPLLPNEYLSDMSHVNGSVHKYTCSFKLNEKPTVRHHKSTPITPSRRVEDV
ncbi:phospholipid phosphatase 1-like isoform X2 [Mya arenaria]|uniref:phospholipid phosphatase 1-like isoform X2 n=1 Tax=Mya arenaria TaxID=6604 RepID=UPI0022E67F33|nr:phospholipid phosphatase 1-like isoform X2 [Mya arenaria]